jgi:hypothetical protein
MAPRVAANRRWCSVVRAAGARHRCSASIRRRSARAQGSGGGAGARGGAPRLRALVFVGDEGWDAQLWPCTAAGRSDGRRRWGQAGGRAGGRARWRPGGAALNGRGAAVRGRAGLRHTPLGAPSAAPHAGAAADCAPGGCGAAAHARRQPHRPTPATHCRARRPGLAQPPPWPGRTSSCLNPILRAHSPTTPPPLPLPAPARRRRGVTHPMAGR